jgi:hypothetical protein
VPRLAPAIERARLGQSASATNERDQEVGHFDIAAMAAETNETIAEISLK